MKIAIFYIENFPLSGPKTETSNCAFNVFIKTVQRRDYYKIFIFKSLHQHHLASSGLNIIRDYIEIRLEEIINKLSFTI